MVAVGKKKRTPATRSGSGEEDRVRGAKTEEVGVEVDAEKISMVREEVETKNIKRLET